MKRFVAALAAGLWLGVAAGQAYPDKPIRFIVPFAPGGNLDFIARTLQPKLSEYLGVPVVIENKAGAGGIVGAAFAAQQPPDGYTIYLGNTGTNAIYPAIYDKLPYDPFKDFVPVARTTTNEFLAVISPAVPREQPEGVHRLRQGQPRQGERRGRRHRLVDPFRVRDD